MMAVEEFVELVGQIAARAGLTALYTSGPGPDETDLVVYLEPEMVNELMRIRFARGEDLPRRVEVGRRAWKLLSVEHT